MDSIVENDCNFYQNGTSFFNHVKDCEQGQREFSEDVKAIEPLRHKYGAAILSGKSSKNISAIKKNLKKVATKLKDKYDDKVDECFGEHYDDSACGYLVAFDRYVDALGPLDSIKQSYDSPRKLSLKPMNIGFLVFDFDNGDELEGMFDSGAEVTAFPYAFFSLFNKYFSYFFDVEDSNDKAYLMKNMGLKFAGDEFMPGLGVVTPVIDNYYQGIEDRHVIMSLVGTDYLISNPFEVDYDTWTMTFDFDVKKRIKDGKWHQIPLYLGITGLNGYMLSMDVYINGIELRLSFDTGATNTIVFDSCTSSLGELDKTDAISLSIYGTDDAKQAPVKIDFGNEQLIKTIHLEAPDSKFQKGLGTSNCGALGIDVLRHFDYIYDPNTLSLYVRKRENNPTFDEKFYLGADIKNKDDGALINSIEEGSLLANAGLKEGDLIVEIEGVKISSTLGILGLLNLLMSTENNVPIKYKRDGKILNGFLRKH